MNNNILGCVYIIKCIKNNKIYVGQTIDIKRRIWEHKHALEGSKHKNKYLQEDFNKYGIASFNVIVIKENLDRKARLLLETELIQKYQIAVATIMNLIKYGETYNPSNYKH